MHPLLRNRVRSHEEPLTSSLLFLVWGGNSPFSSPFFQVHGAVDKFSLETLRSGRLLPGPFHRFSRGSFALYILTQLIRGGLGAHGWPRSGQHGEKVEPNVCYGSLIIRLENHSGVENPCQAAKKNRPFVECSFQSS